MDWTWREPRRRAAPSMALGAGSWGPPIVGIFAGLLVMAGSVSPWTRNISITDLDSGAPYPHIEPEFSVVLDPIFWIFFILLALWQLGLTVVLIPVTVWRIVVSFVLVATSLGALACCVLFIAQGDKGYIDDNRDFPFGIDVDYERTFVTYDVGIGVLMIIAGSIVLLLTAVWVLIGSLVGQITRPRNAYS